VEEAARSCGEKRPECVVPELMKLVMETVCLVWAVLRDPAVGAVVQTVVEQSTVKQIWS
jgi:hypothetical protein